MFLQTTKWKKMRIKNGGEPRYGQRIAASMESVVIIHAYDIWCIGICSKDISRKIEDNWGRFGAIKTSVAFRSNLLLEIYYWFPPQTWLECSSSSSSNGH